MTPWPPQTIETTEDRAFLPHAAATAMRTLWVLLFLTMTATAGCLSSEGDDDPWTYDPTSLPATTPTATQAPAPVLAADPNDAPGTRFVAIGDQGTGAEGQYAVARQIEAVCAVRGCDFAVALGDNIYEVGTADAYDPQFETKFEQPYANLSFPFYLVQGNHDNSYDPVLTATPFGGQGIGHWYEAGNHEVEYSQRTDRTSDKWTMPARYYDFQEGPATFFALDTNLLMFWGFGLTLDGEDGTVPMDQETWFDDALASSNTPWRIVLGHHPYLSNGQHGDAGDYDQTTPNPDEVDDAIINPNAAAGPYVEMFYEDHVCGNVDFILTGHDHDLQWLMPQQQCGATQQLVSGAGAKSRSAGDPDRNPAFFQQYEVNGFLWVEMTDTTFTGVFYDADGNVLFEQTVTKQA